MKKKLVYLCMLSLLSMLLLAGCGNKEEKNNPYYNSDNYLSGTHYAVIDVLDYGEIYVELYADVAPATVTNFVNLAEEGFYDGLTFHRIIDGFMIQGGDPAANGSGKAEYTIPGEFSRNDFDNTINHTRGILSMARAEDYNSASCQFFIVQEDAFALDGYYAAFGNVLSGMEIVDAICADVPVEDDNGTVLYDNQPIIQSIDIIEKDEVIYDTENDNEEEATEIELPDSTAVLNIYNLEGADNLPVAATMEIDTDGRTYYLTTTEPLQSISVYKINLANGLEFSEENRLASTTDFSPNTFLALTLNVPEDLSLLLVAEEPNGALGRYLIGFDKKEEVPYLIPVL